MNLFGSQGTSHGDHYGRTLGSMLRSYRLWDPDYALSRDPQVYDRMRRDPVIGFALRLRKLMAAGRDWYIEAAGSDDKAKLMAQVMEDLLKQIEYFDAARFNLGEAIVAGSRWAKIEGETRTLAIAGQKPREWRVCVRLRDIDKRRFRQFPVDLPSVKRTVRVPTSSGEPTFQVLTEQRRVWVWQIWRPLQQVWETIDRDSYVRHVNDDREDTLGYGGGLASELYTYWFAKEVALQHGLQFLERWAQGVILAKVETLRDGQASSPTSTERMQKWLTVLETMRSRHALVMDAKDSIEIKDAPTGGLDSCMTMIRYLDGSMRVAILGASLPTQSEVEGGSYALADVQAAVSQTLARFDAAGKEETIRRDVLGWLKRENHAIFVELGLEHQPLPFFKIREDRKDNHESRANVLLKAQQAGMDVREDEAYAQLGFTPPGILDKVLDAQSNESMDAAAAGHPLVQGLPQQQDQSEASGTPRGAGKMGGDGMSEKEQVATSGNRTPTQGDQPHTATAKR